MKMIRSLLLGAACVGLLAACNEDQVKQAISQVQGYTKTACKYVPTAASVASILSSATIIDTASGIAGEICTAVTTLPLADGPGKRQPVVRGVVVQGKFVR